MERYYKVINDDTGEVHYVKINMPISHEAILGFCNCVFGFDCNRVEAITKEEFQQKHEKNLIGG